MSVKMFRGLLSNFLLAMVAVCAEAHAPQDAVTLNQTVGGVRQGRWRVEGRGGKTDEGNYVDGKKDGVWVTTSAEGVVRSRVTFAKGVPKGEAAYFYPDGEVMERGYWNVDHWEGDYGRFHPNGNKACEFHYDASGRRQGRQAYFHENGKLLFDGNWVGGKISGSLSIYNDQGRKVMERNYDESGNFQGAQEVDVASGEALTGGREFRASGNFTIYDAAGRKEQTGQFRNGLLISGQRFRYDDKGRLVATEIVRDGKVVETRKRL